jgi:hypothetical protein
VCIAAKWMQNAVIAPDIRIGLRRIERSLIGRRGFETSLDRVDKLADVPGPRMTIECLRGAGISRDVDTLHTIEHAPTG